MATLTPPTAATSPTVDAPPKLMLSAEMIDDSKASEIGVGIINLPILMTMHKVLLDTPNTDDKHLAAWVHENYFLPPPKEGEDGRVIKSDDYFRKLYAAYQRVQQLTARACPEKCRFHAPIGT